jgi:glyoxalase family protein
VQSLRGVTLWVESSHATLAVLNDVFGYGIQATHGNVVRARATVASPESWIDVREVGGFLQSMDGSGTVDHVAFRVKGLAELSALREELRKRGLSPTPVIDRHYFSSVYVREPGGVLVEAATEGPGFTGTVFAPDELLRVTLPPWLEPQRERIENELPPLHFP